MSDHLPECIYAPRNVDPKKGIEWGGQPCICPALRACEQRVRMEDDDYAYVSAQAEAGGRMRGWSEALNAAREAVFSCHLRLDSGKILRQGGDWENAIDKACRAIDALQTKP